MRPRYETAETLRTEAVFVAQALVAWNVRLLKQPLAYELDFRVVDRFTETRLGWLEYKRRHCASTTYLDTRLSRNKWEAGTTSVLIEAANFRSQAALFVVQFDDRTVWWDFRERDPQEAWLDRTVTGRDDWQDGEPAVAFLNAAAHAFEEQPFGEGARRDTPGSGWVETLVRG